MLRISLALAASCLVVLAGCGGSDDEEPLSKAQYEEQVTAVLEGASSDIVRLGNAVSRAGAPERAEERIETLQTRLDKAADELDGIEAPNDITEAHAQLIRGLRALSDEVGEYEDDASVPLADYERMENFFDEVSSSRPVRDITEAARQIEQRGYELGSDHEVDREDE